MKFKFCGDGDCPLWALAALHALGSLPAPLFRALLERVLDEEDDAVMELLKDTSLGSREESARAAAVIRWAVRSAWAASCGGGQLARDLAVLGVPRPHAAALADALDRRRAGYVEGLATAGFAVNKLTDISASPGPPGTVDAIKLTFHSGTQETRSDLLIDRAQAKELLEQLKVAYKKMQDMEVE